MHSIETASLIKQIHTKGPFVHLSDEQLALLMESAQLEETNPDEFLIHQGETTRDYFLLLEGELEVIRHFSSIDNAQHIHVDLVKAGEGVGEMSLLSSLPRSASVRATHASKIMRINGDKMDELLAWSEEFSDHLSATAKERSRINLLHQSKGFSQLPLHNIQAAIRRMQVLSVNNEDIIIKQGDVGDRYFLMEEGNAEVWRTDPISDETACVAILKPGDTFGEEALILNGYRNATIKMISAGSLLFLSKADFDELIKGELMSEIDAEQAKVLLQEGQASLIDCRYDMEYEESHIPGSLLIPLDRIREGAIALDKSKMYVVYCRSGRRSACATFLLRERGFNAFSMTGGVRDWPYELECETVD